MLIYLDSNVVIYLIEQTPTFGPKTTARINAAMAAGDSLAVSDIVRLECRLGPIVKQNQKLLTDFDVFFAQHTVKVVPLPTAVYDRATLIRAYHNYKLADALNLAAAVEARCDRFLTNDTRLNKFPNITVEVLV